MEKSIIFDLDGTLWNTVDEIATVWISVAKKYNIEIEEKNIKSIMGMTKEEIINCLFKNNRKLGENFVTECQNEENKYLEKKGGTLYINTLNTLKKLCNLKCELYIVSNCQDGYIEAFLKFYKLSHIFKDYECSGRTGRDKEYNISIILKRNNITDAIYVGDTYTDYISAKNNDIDFIWAEYGFGNVEERVSSIKDISKLIEYIDMNPKKA